MKQITCHLFFPNYSSLSLFAVLYASPCVFCGERDLNNTGDFKGGQQQISREMMQQFRVYTEDDLDKHKKNAIISALTFGS